jgi:non-ribosomal peptide synthetase component F
VLLSALAVVISAHENTRDVIIGTPVSRRGSGGLDHVIGCLTDLFPLRQTLSPGESFADLVARGKHLVHGAIVHRDISYAEIQRLAAPRLRPGMARLCETVLVVDDAGTDRLQVVGAQAERLYVPPSVAKFDLCLTLVAEGDGYLGLLDYATDLRNEADARQLADDYCRALDRLLASPDVPLGDAVGKCATRVIV